MFYAHILLRPKFSCGVNKACI